MTRFFLLFALASSALAAGPGNSNDFGGKRVLIIGIDGLRSDSLKTSVSGDSPLAPNIAALVAGGVTTWNATAGGGPGGATQQPTISGPGWTSMLTGTYIDRHGVSGNGTTAVDTPGGYQVTAAPHFARRLKTFAPTAEISSIVSWNWIDDYLVAAQPAYFTLRSKGTGGSYPQRDESVKNQALSYIAAGNPDVLFLHFDQVDGAGHGTGFGLHNPNYATAIANVDAQVGAILNAIAARPQYAAEDWLVIVSTDHGGTGANHGGQSLAERTIFLIVSGAHVAQGREENDDIGHHAVPAIVFKHLGLSADPGWNPGIFGFYPYVDGETGGNSAHLRWQFPPGGLAGCTGIEVRENGALLATLPAEAVEYTKFPAAAGMHSFEVSFLGTEETRPLRLEIPALPDTASDLVLHLPFDDSSEDVSGRGNHATAVGTPVYVPGFSGKAAVLNASQSFNLGQPADLKFGADTDFTISFRVRAPSAWSGDPSFISNKNWDSGANTGWIVAAANNTRAWQWNFKGEVQSRKDFDPAAADSNLADGTWRLITAAHSRTGNAVFYHDGRQIGAVSIAGAGNVDTSSDIRIGRDGNNGYAFNSNVEIDDLRIWRRALSAADVASLAPSLDELAAWRNAHFTPVQLADPLVSGNTADADSDGVPNLVEYATGTNPVSAADTNPLVIESAPEGLLLRWPQPNGGAGENGRSYTARGVRYLLQKSTSLLPDSWEEAGDSVEETDPPVFTGDGWHHPRFRIVDPAGPLFFRLQVETH